METTLGNETEANQLNAVVLTKPEQANLVAKNLQFPQPKCRQPTRWVQLGTRLSRTSISANPMQSVCTIAKIATDELGKDK
jgi:hypothetical protein